MSDSANLSPLERARLVAAKITGTLPDGMSGGGKRSADSSEDGSAKKFASVNDAIGSNLQMLKQQNYNNGGGGGGGYNNGGGYSEEYKVPDKQIGLVIGRQGEQIHKLQNESGCKIVIGTETYGTDRIITLNGTRESVEHVKQMLDDLLQGKRNNGGGGDYGNQNGQGKFEIYEMRVPGNKCGLVIGKGGETIKGLSERFGVKLVVVQETTANSAGDKPLRITGEPDKIAKAKEAVLALINPDSRGPNKFNDYGSRSGGYGNPGGNETVIKVPGDKAGIVIGKGGESIKEINRRSGAHVEIDKSQRNNTDTSTDKMFIIRGTPEQVQMAQQLIFDRISGERSSTYFNDDNDSYGNSSSQSAATSAYGAQQQWPYQQAAGAWPTDPKAAAAAVDPNYYYQQYYNQYYQQAAGQTAATPAAATAAGGAAATTAQAQINPQTGQADYSQAWVEYYRSLGMHEQAENIIKQTQANAATGGANGQAGAQSGAGASQTNGQATAASAAASAYGNPAAAWSGYAGYQQGYPGYPSAQASTNGSS